MIERSNLDWYKGPTLLEALDLINEPKCPSDKPLRLPVQDATRLEAWVLSPLVVLSSSLEWSSPLAPRGSPLKLSLWKCTTRLYKRPFLVTMFASMSRIAVKDVKRSYVASNSKKDPAKEAAKYFTSQVSS